jgi:hypothetical protein
LYCIIFTLKNKWEKRKWLKAEEIIFAVYLNNFKAMLVVKPKTKGGITPKNPGADTRLIFS